MVYKDANGQTYAGADGQLMTVKRTKWELVCNNVEFLGKNPNSNAYAPVAAGTVVQPVAAVAAVAAPVAAAAPAAVVNPATMFVQAPTVAAVAAPVVAAGPETVAGTFVPPVGV